MRKIEARWVPHMLSESEKHQRLNIARKLLKRYGEDGDEMLRGIVAIDETWIRSFEPKLNTKAMNGIQKILKTCKIPSKSELCQNVDDLCI